MYILLLCFIQGIFTFFSPCTLPIIPVYFAYLGADNTFKDKKYFFLNLVGFILGFIFIFVFLGATATYLGHFLKINLPLFKKLSGIIIVLLGLQCIGIFEKLGGHYSFLIKFNTKNLNFFKSIFFGIVFSFIIASPCSFPLLGSILVLASTSSTVYQGVILLFVYGIGFSIPFILTAIFFNRITKIFSKVQKYSTPINFILGILLVIVGILIIIDKLKYFNIIL